MQKLSALQSDPFAAIYSGLTAFSLSLSTFTGFSLTRKEPHFIFAESVLQANPGVVAGAEFRRHAWGLQAGYVAQPAQRVHLLP